MKIICLGTYSDGKEFWLPSREMNALYYMNGYDRKIKYMGIFPDCSTDMAWIIRRVIEYQNELFFFSYVTYQVWILNKESKEIKAYTYYPNANVQISNIEVIGREAWIIPNDFSSPIIYFELKMKRAGVLKWDKKIHLASDIGMFTKAVSDNSKLYFATRNKNNIFLCIVNCSIKKIIMNRLKGLLVINCIGVKNKKLFVLGKDAGKRDVLQIYNSQSLKKTDEFELSMIEKLPEDGALKYIAMVIKHNYVVLIPALAKYVLIYDWKKKVGWNIEYPNTFCLYQIGEKEAIFNEIKDIGDKIYFMPHGVSQILILDLDKQCFEVMDFEISKTECKKVYDNLRNKKDHKFYESKIISLIEFVRDIDCLSDWDGNMAKDSYGSRIYRYLDGRWR